MHGTLKNLLRTAALELQPTGGAMRLPSPQLLARITMQYNSTINATLKMTPFHVFFGRPPPPSGPPQLTEDVEEHREGDDGGGDGGDGDDGGSGGGYDQGNGRSGSGYDQGDGGGGNFDQGDADGGGGSGDDVDEQDNASLRMSRQAKSELMQLRPWNGSRYGFDTSGKRKVRPKSKAREQDLEAAEESDEEEEPALTATMSLRDKKMGSARNRLGGLVVSGVDAYKSSIAKSPQDGNVENVKYIMALVWDRRFQRILYLLQGHQKGQGNRWFQEFAPASALEQTDELVQKNLVNRRKVAFVGGLSSEGYMGAIDRKKDDPVKVSDVVAEVENKKSFNDGQKPMGEPIDNNEGAGSDAEARAPSTGEQRRLQQQPPPASEEAAAASAARVSAAATAAAAHLASVANADAAG